MALPPRSHYPLDEVAHAWGTTTRAMLGYGVESRLAISMLLFGQRVDRFQTSDGGEAVPIGRTNISGAHALSEQDLWTLNSRGTVIVRRFRTSDGYVAEVAQDHPGIEIAQSELVVTAEERLRFEQANGIVPMSSSSQATADGVPFSHDATYSAITIDGRCFQLSAKRAAVVRLLHEAWLGGSPWMRDHMLLEQAGSYSARLVDLFKPVKGWRDIIESDRKGNWRLRLPARTDDQARKRHFRRPALHLVR
jgi:hypothetical protein